MPPEAHLGVDAGVTLALPGRYVEGVGDDIHPDQATTDTETPYVPLGAVSEGAKYGGAEYDGAEFEVTEFEGAEPLSTEPIDFEAPAPPSSGTPAKAGWRRRTAGGAILTGMALGFQQVFEEKHDEPAVTIETSGVPPEDLAVEADFDGLAPRRSIVKIRPWLLRRSAETPITETPSTETSTAELGE